MRVTFVLSWRGCHRGPEKIFRSLRGSQRKIFRQSAGSLMGAG
jgi:hypothetical protein